MTQACIGLWLLCQVATADTPTEGVESGPPAEAAVAAPAECALPVCGALGEKIYCIEGWESNHKGNAVNRRSGAAGWLQWLPGTARAWGVTIGNRQSEWQAAARIAAQGERFFRTQWVPLQLGLC